MWKKSSELQWVFRQIELLVYMFLSDAMQVIEAADEVIDSIDMDELAKFFAFKSDPEDEEAEVCFRDSTLSVFFFAIISLNSEVILLL